VPHRHLTGMPDIPSEGTGETVEIVREVADSQHMLQCVCPRVGAPCAGQTENMTICQFDIDKCYVKPKFHTGSVLLLVIRAITIRGEVVQDLSIIRTTFCFSISIVRKSS
jgi:hypothetical protein